MTLDEARRQLGELQRKLSAYQHAMSVIHFDGVTVAPRGTGENRAQTMAVLSGEQYRLAAGAETAALLDFLDGQRPSLTAAEARQTDLLRKELRMLERIPEEEYISFQRLISQAEDVWHRAKAENDWPSFAPLLTRIFDTRRRFAAYCAPEMAAYDFWLDRYEEGLTTERCDAFFSVLRERVVPLLRRVLEKPRPDCSILRGTFPAEAQAAFSRRLMEVMGLDPDHVGLAETEHPFTTTFGSHLDERIATHYYEDDFSSSMYSVIHEGGHALYDTGSAAELAYTVLDGGVSMGIHESQSRFYENILGRSRAFCDFLLPLAAEYFPQLHGRGADELYRAVNRVEPGPIRVDADELTYALHILVRYELEKRVMAGELTVAELPREWNRLYREYLGVEVPDDRRGVLQDSHWSGGDVGYFPSYALGSAYGAQFLRRMRQTVDVDGCLRRGDFAPINDWLRQRVWQYGCLYRPGELFERAVGESFDPTAFTDYLEKKYTALYAL